MDILIIFLGAILAGLLGSLTGLGGGIIIIPLLSEVLGYNIKYAIGAGLIAVIATSTGASSTYVKKGLSNIYIGLFLVIATTAGAVSGALIAQYTSVKVLSILFGCILLFTGFMQFRKHADNFVPAQSGSLASKLQLTGKLPNAAVTDTPYEAQKPFLGFFIMLMAGALSGLLGIGSGVLKVLAMDNVMKLPFKISTATSTFMIGLTAIASAVFYFQEGYIVASIAAPVMLGVLIGSGIGSKLLTKINTKILKQVFAIVVLIIALQMINKGLK